MRIVTTRNTHSRERDRSATHPAHSPRTGKYVVAPPWEAWDTRPGWQSPTLGTQSALDCLQDQGGNSAGKSRLLVALCRNRGIPARVVTGPHIMLLPTDTSQLDVYPTDWTKGGPWVMWKGTPYAHIMVPITATPKSSGKKAAQQK